MKSMSDDEKIQYLQSLIELLEDSAHLFARKISKPIFIKQKGKERFKYLDPQSIHFQILKAVRIVSGLHACIVLHKVGHVQEMGIIFRTIHEALTEIDFVQEAHETGNPTADQQRIIDLFFAKELKTTDELVATKPNIFKIPRKKIRSSAARLAAPYMRSEKLIRMLEIFDDVWSGYVHGEYPHIMELYEANFDDGTSYFRMRGMLDTPRMQAFHWQLASFVMNALNRFIIIARNLKLEELATKILGQRKELEKSASYMEHP